MGDGVVHSLHVFLDNFFALLAIGVTNRLANSFNCLVTRQYLGNGKEADLHDRVHATAHARIASDFVGVDDVELGFLGNELLLHDAGQVVPDLFRTEGTVEQESAARDERSEHVIAFQEYPLMTGYEVGLRNEIGGTDRLGSET